MTLLAEWNRWSCGIGDEPSFLIFPCQALAMVTFSLVFGMVLTVRMQADMMITVLTDSVGLPQCVGL